MPTDTELLIRSRADPEAFGTLYERHAASVHAYLARRLGPGQAEELLSEVFLRALEARHRTRPHHSDSVLPWMYGIARNVVRSHLRSARGRPPQIEQAPFDWTGVDARLDADAISVDLRRVLEGLSEGEREVLLLVSWEQLSIGEAADTLGIAIGAARTRLHRARAHAAAALAAVPHPYQDQEN